jgi:sugar phosphate isomerase/epimerase
MCSLEPMADRMQLGIFAKTFAGADPGRVLGAAADAGYACVQFNMACAGLPSLPDRIEDSTLAAIDAARAATGVGIAAISGTYNMVHPDPAVRRDGLQRLKTIIAAAHSLGIPVVTLCTGTRDPNDQWRHHPENADPAVWRTLCGEMEQAVGVAEVHGVRLGIEPELANVVSSARRARDLIDDLRSPCLAVVLDPANLFEVMPPAAQQVVIAEAIDLLADRLAMAHAKDRSADGSFVAPGEGTIDFADFIRRLNRAGFTGPLVTHGLSADEAQSVAVHLKALLSSTAS